MGWLPDGAENLILNLEAAAVRANAESNPMTT